MARPCVWSDGIACISRDGLTAHGDIRLRENLFMLAQEVDWHIVHQKILNTLNMIYITVL